MTDAASSGAAASRPPTSSCASSIRSGDGGGGLSPRHTSRRAMLADRKADMLCMNSQTFGRPREHRGIDVRPKPYHVPAPPPAAVCSHHVKFESKRVFNDPSPPRSSATGLPCIPSARRAAHQPPSKPFELSSPRFLHAKLPSTARPNTGTLNDGAPMYSSFSKDTVFRGHLPRGDLELTLGLTNGGTMGTAERGVFGGGTLPPSRTLVR